MIRRGKCSIVVSGFCLFLTLVYWVREFWRRHKRKVYVTFGVLGSGYLLYKLYDGHRRRLSDLERELADERRNEELIKSQLRFSLFIVYFPERCTLSFSSCLVHNIIVCSELLVFHL